MPLEDSVEAAKTATLEYPPQLLEDTDTGPDGLRWLFIGDDGDHLVILGHPEQERVTAAVKTLCDLSGDAIVDSTYVWARLLTECPTHHGTQPAACRMCAEASPERWWLDWIADPPGSNDHRPGYFPITVNEC
jgi:hypothetical protein